MFFFFFLTCNQPLNYGETHQLQAAKPLFELYTPYVVVVVVVTVHWPNVFISLSSTSPSLLKNQQEQRMCEDFLIHNVAFNETVFWGCLTKKKLMLICLWFCDHS